jgi:hypothetical protein
MSERDDPRFVEWWVKYAAWLKRKDASIAYEAARAPLLEENERLRLNNITAIAGLEMDMAELRKDAERYRWIRNKTDEPDEAYYYLPSVWRWYSPGPGKLNEQHQTLDAAIDAALEPRK